MVLKIKAIKTLEALIATINNQIKRLLITNWIATIVRVLMLTPLRAKMMIKQTTKTLK
jgi:hypothetical protein